MFPNWSQLSGAVDRVTLIALTYAASKGWITPSDVAGIATMVVGIAGSVYAFYVNRNTNLAKQAASIPNTTVVTTPEIAAATPQLNNVVSTTEVKVTNK